jgi:hypothetical protein
MPSSIAKHLEFDGIVCLPELVSQETLREMQAAFAARLNRLRWNDQDGYERTELYRHMVQDILTLGQGFVDVALHPLVQDALDEYLGDSYALVEAKGWKSLPTVRDFHGWHGDAWYDQEKVTDHIPREVKLAFYLTDVKSGAFQYLRGTHGKQAPRGYGKGESQTYPREQLVEMTGAAGTAFLFDTSGIHRQACPIVEPREAFFLNYHDPKVPLQKEDLDYYRYHPLLLNAALLSNLTSKDMQILGFGNKTNYVPAYQRQARHAGFQHLMRTSFGAKLVVGEIGGRMAGKFRSLLGGNGTH